MKTCVFIGLEDIFKEEMVEQRLEREVEKLILDGYTTFRMGNRELFDILALHVCRKLREKYPYIKIEVVYTAHKYFLFERLSVKKKFEKDVEKFYGDVKMKSYHVEEVPLIYRLIVNNRAMILDCDIVVCYYNHRVDHRLDYVHYAKIMGKRTINVFSELDLRF